MPAIYLIICAVLGKIIFTICGHRIIRPIYEGRSTDFLNKLISGQDRFPVEAYYKAADRYISLALVLFVAAGILLFYLARHKKFAASAIKISVATLALFECTITLLLAFPVFRINFVYRVYVSAYRNIISVDSKSAIYDEELTYTLKPGVFFFSNPEFNNEYRVNRLGLRDDEASLVAPEIIVAGDSTAMGWGVNQDEYFPAIIERESGKSVLSCAVASYGTVREMRFLDRVNTSRLRYLIVDYNFTDLDENLWFYKHNTVLKMSEAEYNQLIRNCAKAKRYYPGKYANLLLFRPFYNFITKYNLGIGEFPDEKIEKSESELFINALVNACHVDLSKVKIIVLGNSSFTASLKAAIAGNDYPAYIKNMDIINLSGVLTKNHYYILDDHIRASGHKVIAKEILRSISR